MRMKAFAAVALLISSAAHAGPYSDDLAKCLVSSTSKEDRIALVRWMFAAASAHPAVASIAKVSPKTMDEANASTGALFMRLLTDSCKDKAKTALQYEGPATMQTSFTVLGQVAATEMFSSPEVKQAMAGLEKHVDPKKLQELTGK
jgi:hypothetical protein